MATNALAPENSNAMVDAPKLSDVLEELKRNKAVYQQTYDKLARNKDIWKGYSLFRNPVALAAFNLFSTAAKTKDPDSYLATLTPYGDSRVRIDFNAPAPSSGAKGHVDYDQPSVANLYSEAYAPTTLPHELEHTLQITRPIPTIGGNDSNKGVPVGALSDEQGRALSSRISALPAKHKAKMFHAENAFDNDYETRANIASYAQNLAAKGVSFLDTPEGKALYPDRAAQDYFVKTIMPGTVSMYGYREDRNAPASPRRPTVDPNTPYANQMYNRVLNYFGR